MDHAARAPSNNTSSSVDAEGSRNASTSEHVHQPSSSSPVSHPPAQHRAHHDIAGAPHHRLVTGDLDEVRGDLVDQLGELLVVVPAEVHPRGRR